MTTHKQSEHPQPHAAKEEKEHEVKAGDKPTVHENKSSTGAGTTQKEADEAAGGVAYRVLENIAYDAQGKHAHAKPGDIVELNAKDAKGLLKAHAVERADSQNVQTHTDPRKIV